MPLDSMPMAPCAHRRLLPQLVMEKGAEGFGVGDVYLTTISPVVVTVNAIA